LKERCEGGREGGRDSFVLCCVDPMIDLWNALLFGEGEGEEGREGGREGGREKCTTETKREER